MITTRVRRSALVAAVVFLDVAAGSARGHAKCSPTSDPDLTDVANARAAVAANCDCSGATSHGAYVRCAAQQAKLALVNKSCAGTVKRCAARSTCGKPEGAVTCCVTKTSGTNCTIKRDAAHCRAGAGATACAGSYTSCCDACTSTGCAAVPTTTSSTATTSTSTTTTTTTSCPPATGLYCGRQACGVMALCPAGMSCTDVAQGCTCVGTPIPCGDIVSGFSLDQCHWGTCPEGTTCGPVPKQGTCGYDCVCQ